MWKAIKRVEERKKGKEKNAATKRRERRKWIKTGKREEEVDVEGDQGSRRRAEKEGKKMIRKKKENRKEKEERRLKCEEKERKRREDKIGRGN